MFHLPLSFCTAGRRHYNNVEGGFRNTLISVRFKPFASVCWWMSSPWGSCFTPLAVAAGNTQRKKERMTKLMTTYHLVKVTELGIENDRLFWCTVFNGHPVNDGFSSHTKYTKFLLLLMAQGDHRQADKSHRRDRGTKK
jgi:hypothetical protein